MIVCHCSQTGITQTMYSNYTETKVMKSKYSRLFIPGYIYVKSDHPSPGQECLNLQALQCPEQKPKYNI